MNINKSIRFFLALLWLAPIGLHAQQRQDSIGTKMPGIVAHRGFHQFESSAENSISALQTAVSIGANVFQFFTRNPRGGAAKPIDKADVKAFLAYAAEKGIGPILAHAPYTLNAAGAEDRVREFAESTMRDDLKRLELTPGALYNFHPGSHTGQGVETGIREIAEGLNCLLPKAKIRCRIFHCSIERQLYNLQRLYQ